jgi:hypothetical protein
VTGIHEFLGRAAAGLAATLVVAAAWSIVDGRRTSGALDHRFVVDRLILLNVAVVAANVLAGALVAAGGGRPADALHLLYGVAAVVVLPLGWTLGGRPGPNRRPSRARRDAWVLAAALVLLGVEVRLVATG